MTVASTEVYSGGDIRDPDGCMVTSVRTGGGKTLLFGSISTAASGQTLLLAAQGAGLKIKVVSYVVVASAAVTVQFQSAASALTGAMALAANGGLVVQSTTAAHVFETAANAALNINLGGAVQVSGHFSYFVE